MATYKRRIQHRHGTYSQFQTIVNNNGLLEDEIIIVDSGDPNTTSGASVYFKPRNLTPKRILTEENVFTANSVKSNMIQSGAVTNDKLANTSVSTSKIQDGAITNDKLASEVKNDFVPSTRKIANIALSQDITTAQLKDKLKSVSYSTRNSDPPTTGADEGDFFRNTGTNVVYQYINDAWEQPVYVGATMPLIPMISNPSELANLLVGQLFNYQGTLFYKTQTSYIEIKTGTVTPI